MGNLTIWRKQLVDKNNKLLILKKSFPYKISKNNQLLTIIYKVLF